MCGIFLQNNDCVYTPQQSLFYCDSYQDHHISTNLGDQCLGDFEPSYFACQNIAYES